MLALPVGRNYDTVDVFGLLGRLLDQMVGKNLPEKPVEEPAKDYGFDDPEDKNDWI